MTHRLDSVESSLETTLHITSKLAGKFSRAELKIVPAKRSSFHEFAESWATLRSRSTSWQEIVTTAQNGFE
eukprot:2202057-Prorocentrum_lima.AAC.1